MIDLSTPTAVAAALPGLTTMPVTRSLAAVLGFPSHEFHDGWVVGVLCPQGGDVVVLYHDRDKVANVRYYDSHANFLRVESHDLSETGDLYFVERRQFGRMVGVKRVREDNLDDTNPAAVVAGTTAKSARLDQFFTPSSFFRVECSEDLPAEVLAHAVLAAWEAVEREVTPLLDRSLMSRA